MIADVPVRHADDEPKIALHLGLVFEVARHVLPRLFKDLAQNRGVPTTGDGGARGEQRVGEKLCGQITFSLLGDSDPTKATLLLLCAGRSNCLRGADTHPNQQCTTNSYCRAECGFVPPDGLLKTIKSAGRPGAYR